MINSITTNWWSLFNPEEPLAPSEGLAKGDISEPLCTIQLWRQRLCKCLTVIVFLSVFHSPVRAQYTINWGTYPDVEVYDSYGSFITAGNFTPALGVFSGGFTPTLLNMDLWETNWVELDQATIAAPLGDFDSSYVLSAYPPGITAGTQVYVWLYNTQDFNSLVAEWALITDDSADGDSADDWVLPDLLSGSGVIEWRVGEPEGALFGGYLDTPGSGTAVAPATAFTLQTNRLVPVPEPGSLALLVPALLWTLRRRRHSPGAASSPTPFPPLL